MKVGAERAAELVAAGLGDHVDDAALEAAVLGGDVAARDLGLLDGVFDIQRCAAAAAGFVDVHAIDHVEVVVGERARRS